MVVGRFAGDFVTDYAVNGAREVANHIGPFKAGWRNGVDFLFFRN